MKVRKVAARAGMTRKAIGVAVTGVQAWLVAYSVLPPKWLGLTGVVVMIAACYGLTNDAPQPADQGPRDEPAPTGYPQGTTP